MRYRTYPGVVNKRGFKKRFKSFRQQKVVARGDLPDATVRRMVIKYFNDRIGLPIYPSDVAQSLKIDAWQVHRICNDLVEDGKLDYAHNQEVD